jgi:alcohol dehydrogenase
MRAVVVERMGAVPAVRDWDPPVCPPDGALVRVHACGVCRSDWHAWQGHDASVTVPYVPGHEWAGEVVEVGTDVRRWRGGERVTAPFVQACGVCPQCREGEQQVCADQRQPGFTHDGAFADLVVAHRADLNLVALPAGIDAVTAASLGCRFATAYRAVAGHGGVRTGWWVAGHGCGGVGLSAVMVAGALGARVVAVDVSDAALDAATSLGAEVTVDARDGFVAEAVRRRTDGGVHVSLDAVGSTATALASIASLRPRGRHVQVGLLLGADSPVPVPLDRVLAEELTIVGSHGLAAFDYPALLELVSSGALAPDRLVARTIGLGDAGAELAAMDTLAGQGGMTVIDLRLG